MLRYGIMCFIGLFVDLLRPFGEGLSVEFLFLSVLFIAFRAPLWQACLSAVIAGYAKDSLVWGQWPAVSTVEFCLVSVSLYHVRRRLQLITKPALVVAAQTLTVVAALIVHACVSDILAHTVATHFCLQFIVHSLILYFALSAVLNRRHEPFSETAYL